MHMLEISIDAYAKINLALDVTGKRPDGYHNVRMVMQMIDLHDSVSIRAELSSEPQIVLAPGRADLPAGRGNLGYLAAEIFMKETGLAIKTVIEIEKRIPAAAGLAGGSTDAAAVLLGLNAIFKTGLSITDLMRIGVRIGADVPFCVMGNAAAGNLDPDGSSSSCALAEGIGDILTPLKPKDAKGPFPVLTELFLVLTKPPIDVPTAKVYQALDLRTIGKRPDTSELIDGLMENDLEKVTGNMINILENVTLKEYPIVMYTKNNLLDTKPIVALMSGSGPSIFGIFKEKSKAEDAWRIMAGSNAETYLVRTK